MSSLELNDYKRYGRQMILDGFGLPAQLKLCRASVVVVGAGGLGCPALQYLAASGIGTFQEQSFLPVHRMFAFR